MAASVRSLVEFARSQQPTDLNEAKNRECRLQDWAASAAVLQSGFSCQEATSCGIGWHDRFYFGSSASSAFFGLCFLGSGFLRLVVVGFGVGLCGRVDGRLG